MQGMVGLLDLLGQFVLPRLERIEMLPEEADGLGAFKHILVRPQHFENTADLGDGNTQPAQRKHITQPADIACQIGAEAAVAGGARSVRPAHRNGWSWGRNQSV